MTVVCLHSTGLSGRQWRLLARRLDRPCITPDFTGYAQGPSFTGDPMSAPGAAWAIDTAHITALVDATPGPIDLVAHSYGGAVAFAVARARPERIRRMVVHEPVLWGLLWDEGPAEHRERLREKFIESRFLEDPEAVDEAWLKVFVDYWSGPGTWDMTLPMSRDALLGLRHKIFAEVRALILDRTPLSGWDAVLAPTCITMGADSPAEERAVCQLLAERSPQRALVELPGGHMAPLTRRRPFEEAVYQFLEGEAAE